MVGRADDVIYLSKKNCSSEQWVETCPRCLSVERKSGTKQMPSSWINKEALYLCLPESTHSSKASHTLSSVPQTNKALFLYAAVNCCLQRQKGGADGVSWYYMQHSGFNVSSSNLNRSHKLHTFHFVISTKPCTTSNLNPTAALGRLPSSRNGTHSVESVTSGRKQ